MQRLARLLPEALCKAWLEEIGAHGSRSQPLADLALNADAVLQTVARSAACALLEAALGPSPWCNLRQSWLRHGRPPHSWHQDGALRHDFLAHAGQPAPADALLEMRTLWMALTPCGQDAPSLQWINAEMPGLLSPPELTHEVMVTRFASAAFEHAELQAGDALLFDGRLLHRTHLTPQMTQPRCSLELRFFRAGALPARVAADQGQRMVVSTV